MMIMDHSPYDFFRDQGNIIAGLLALMAALIAAAAAYRIGRQQVESIEVQNRRLLAADRGRMLVSALALDIECQRIQNSAQATKAAATGHNKIIDFKTTIFADPVIRAPSEGFLLLPTEVQNACLAVLQNINDYNYAITRADRSDEDLRMITVDSGILAELSKIEQSTKHASGLLAKLARSNNGH